MLNKQQKGFVSIIVAATIMIILALITIGFTRFVQREQRQSLDRQLSRQALYAAESGINQTFKVLLENPALDDEKPDCETVTIFGPLALQGHVLDAENGVEYTCVQYDKSPKRLFYNVKDTDSKIIQLTTTSGRDFESLEVSWGNQESINNSVATLPTCSLAGEFPSARVTTIPLLKFDLTSIEGLNRSDLLASTDYLYLSPCRGPGGVTEYDYNTAQKGNIVRVVCAGSDTTPCTLTIKNLVSEASPTFLARFRPVYASANVGIRGNERVTPEPAVTTDDVQFAGQYSIDVTAKAGDVVRRLRAAIPLASTDDKPEAVVQSFTEVCKLLQVNFEVYTIINSCP